MDIMLRYSEACLNIGWVAACDTEKPKIRVEPLTTLRVEKFSVLEIVSRFRNSLS